MKLGCRAWCEEDDKHTHKDVGKNVLLDFGAIFVLLFWFWLFVLLLFGERPEELSDSDASPVQPAGSLTLTGFNTAI